MGERTAEDYRAMMDTVTGVCRTFALCASAISDAEIAAALATIERADAVGPIFLPSEWKEQAARGGLDRQRRMLTAFRRFRDELKALGG